MILGEMGAEVIKVEDPRGGDESRAWPPRLPGDLSGYFAALNRNKRGITVNLKHPRGRQIVHELARMSDIAVENFTPGVVDRLGIGYADLRVLNPKIIYCSISGFGQDGPYRERRGYDPILQAMGGLMGVTGEIDGGPLKTMIPIADLSAGVFSALGLCSALYSRSQTGEGQYLDMSMLDVMVAMTTTVGGMYLHTGVVPPRSGTENPTRVPSAAYECADGVYVQLVPNQRQWVRFCEIIGEPRLAADSRYATPISRIEHRDTLNPVIRAAMKRQDAQYWIDRFVGEGIAAGPIHTLDTLFADPQVVHRGMVGEFRHPVAGDVKAINLPFRLSGTPVQIRSHPPDLGEHTEEVLSQWLGYTAETIAEMRREEAI